MSPGHVLDLYVKRDSPLHRLDDRAKLVGLAGFLVGALAAPARPPWAALALAAALLGAAAVGRLPPRALVRRLVPLALVIGGPFALSRLGGAATRAAGEVFAVRSFLVAAAFAVLMAVARPADLLEVGGRLPLVGGFAALSEFILRGTHLLAGEVVRTNRAWALRAPRPGLRLRVGALTAASISLLGRAAARSERVGAAMALRGFDGRLPPVPPGPLPLSHLAAGLAFGFATLLLGVLGRWL